jgi:hypothetical protein
VGRDDLTPHGRIRCHARGRTTHSGASYTASKTIARSTQPGAVQEADQQAQWLYNIVSLGPHLLLRSRRRSTNNTATATAAAGSGCCLAVAIRGSMRCATGGGSLSSVW